MDNHLEHRCAIPYDPPTMWFNFSRLLPTPGTTALAILVLALSLACLSPAAGHEPVDEQIRALSIAIDRSDDPAPLLLHRAELLRLRGEWEAAAADLRRAAGRGADAVRLALCQAALDLDRDEAARAATRLDALIEDETEIEESYRLRARARLLLGDPEGAIADLDRSLAVSPSPDPELYRERARLVAGAGAGPAAALAGLDEGIARLGPVVPLVLAAVDLEAEGGRPDRALARLDQLDPRYRSRMTALLRRAEILDLAGRKLESLSCYTEALALLEAWPASRRAAPANVELERRIRRALASETRAQTGEGQR